MQVEKLQTNFPMLKFDFKNCLRILILFVIAGVAWYLKESGLFENMTTWLKELGILSAPLFVLLYAVSVVFFVPSIVFTFASGIVFNFGFGVFLSLLGLGLGSTMALLVGRYMAYSFVQEKFKNHRQFQILSRLVQEKGWKIISLARLSPIFPFLIGNYAFGVTKINPITYCWSSMLGSIPAISVYAYLGKVTGSLASLGERSKSPMEWVLLVAGLILTVVMSIYFKKMADTALKTE